MGRAGLSDDLSARVFAYGSNMCMPHLRAWMEARGAVGAIDEVMRASLPDHVLSWNYASYWRKGGAANVMPSPGDTVPGVVMTVDGATLALLDVKEGHPDRYRRAQHTLTTADGAPCAAWVYRVTPAWQRTETVRPTRAYLDLLIRGAEAHQLPGWHLRALRETSVREGPPTDDA